MPIKHKLMLVYNYQTERFGSRRGDFTVTLTEMKPFTSMKMLKKSVMNNWYYDGFKPRVRIRDKFKSLKEALKYYNSGGNYFLRVEKSCKKVYKKYVLPEMGDEYNTMLNFLPTEKQTDEEVAKLVHKCKTDFKFCAKLHNDIATDWEDWYDEVDDFYN